MKDTGEQTRRLQRQAQSGVGTVAGVPPLSITRPELSGDAKVGEVLTCDEGEWESSSAISSFGYKWFQNNTPIIGEVGNTYTVRAEDQNAILHCDVTATNASGSATESSTNVYVIGARYLFTLINAPVTPAGQITIASGSLLLKVHTVDLDGRDHDRSLARLQPGDSIFIGAAEGVLAEVPIGPSSGVYTLPLLAGWTPPANGEYVVTLGYAA